MRANYFSCVLNAFFLFAFTLLANFSIAGSKNIILCGGSPGGLWSLLGAGLNSAVQKISPNSVVTYQTSSGGFANIVQTQDGKCDLSIAHIGEIMLAEKGLPPFTSPKTGTLAVALLYDWAPMQWITDKRFAEENNLRSISDLGKAGLEINLVVNRKGILPSILAEKSLEKSGLSFEQIIDAGGSVQYQGSKAASQIMQDGKADIWVNATFIGSGKIRAIAKVRNLTLLSVDPKIVEEMAEEFGSKSFTIPAFSYDWLNSDVTTFGAQAALIAAKNSDPEKVALIAEAIGLYPEEIKGVHPAMKGFSLDLATSIKLIPYHPEVRRVLAKN